MPFLCGQNIIRTKGSHATAAPVDTRCKGANQRSEDRLFAYRDEGEWSRDDGCPHHVAGRGGTVGVVPAPSAVAKPIEENFSITVAGAFGDAVFTPDNASISVNQSNQIDQQVLQIRVSASNGETMSFDFSTPAGSKQNFDVGYYGHAQRYPFMDPGRPGISMSPLGFCSTQSGNFEVRDIAWDGPAITRIWITYHRYCNNAQSAEIQPAFGEIRLGYPKTTYDVSPRVVRWPEGTYPGKAAAGRHERALPGCRGRRQSTRLHQRHPASGNHPLPDSA